MPLCLINCGSSGLNDLSSIVLLSFSVSHAVDETTTDIICIKCKKDDSESPNEIVLCDSCGIGQPLCVGILSVLHDHVHGPDPKACISPEAEEMRGDS